MKHYYALSLIIAVATIFAACNSGYTRRNPGRNYAPDMVYSRAYDAYTQNAGLFEGKDSNVSRMPIEGTIARGHALPLHLKEEDTAAYYSLKNPYVFNERDKDHGRRVYNIYCGICHGEQMDGNGPLFASGKFASMPANFKLDKYKEMSDGRYYHAIMYGINAMGSYASQLTDKERWQVITYIRQQVSGAGAEASPAGDDDAGAADDVGAASDDTKVAVK